MLVLVGQGRADTADAGIVGEAVGVALVGAIGVTQRRFEQARHDGEERIVARQMLGLVEQEFQRRFGRALEFALVGAHLADTRAPRVRMQRVLVLQARQQRLDVARRDGHNARGEQTHQASLGVGESPLTLHGRRHRETDLLHAREPGVAIFGATVRIGHIHPHPLLGGSSPYITMIVAVDTRRPHSGVSSA